MHNSALQTSNRIGPSERGNRIGSGRPNTTPNPIGRMDMDPARFGFRRRTKSHRAGPQAALLWSFV
eukprot:7725066-Pyramimonas_sp.AAC.1